MKQLPSVETDRYGLDVFECDCGLHIGLSSTFIKYIVAPDDRITIKCPSCCALIIIGEPLAA